jgi:ADP-ribosyl-[dinitrogen reductase] hydrolase
MVMLGAIMGDIAGSLYEGGACRDACFELFSPGSRFTDDTVCTIAIADALLSEKPVADTLREWCQRYPGAGYGSAFNRWLYAPSMGAYHSWANGGAMRVSSCAWFASSLEEAEQLAEMTAAVTHDHPEGLRGARAIAGAIWLARQGLPAAELMRRVEQRHGYILGLDVLKRAGTNPAGSDALDTVPIALDCGIQAKSVLDAIHRAVYIGGDSDTTASMAAAIAEARFGLSQSLVDLTLERITPEMREVLARAYARAGVPMARPEQRAMQATLAPAPKSAWHRWMSWWKALAG